MKLDIWYNSCISLDASYIIGNKVRKFLPTNHELVDYGEWGEVTLICYDIFIKHMVNM